MSKGYGLHSELVLRAYLVMVAVVPLWLGASAPGQAATVCAVIPAADSDVTSNVADLLELKLAQADGITLVSRAEFQALLTEQVLSAALRPEGTRSRLRLGELLKADLLVFLRAEQGEKQVIEVAAAESKRGLRLVVEPIAWDPEQAEAGCDEMVKAVLHARGLAQQRDLEIFAVSPFESEDLSLKYASQRRGFARLIEAYLVRRPGTVVVELEEARALTREVAVSGEQVSRELPYYFVGSYRTAGDADSRKTAITLTLRHGEQELGKLVRQDLPPSKVGETLQEMVADLLTNIENSNTTKPPAKLESRVLIDRAEVFAGIAEWDQALVLYESALLLDPDATRAHMGIFEGRIDLMGEGTPGRYLRSYHRVDYPARMQHAESALDHLEALLLQRLFLEAKGTKGETPPAGDPGAVTFSRILNRLAVFRGQFWIGPDYDRRNDPQGACAAFQHAADRLSDILLRTLADRPTREVLGPHEMRSLVGAIVSAAARQARADDRPGTQRTLDRLMKLLDDQANLTLIVYGVVSCVDDCFADDRRAFLDRLEQSDSERLMMGARVGRIFESIRDEATHTKARADIKALAEANGLSGQVAWLLHALDKRLEGQQRIARRQAQARDKEESQKVSMVPELEPLELTASALPEKDRPSKVTDWLVCNDDLEVVSTDVGIFRVEDGGDLNPIWKLTKRWSGTFRLSWDGHYVWVATWWRGPIFVLDPRAGRLAKFDQSDMLTGVGMPQGILTTAGPGQACLFGYYKPTSPMARNYCTLLRVEPRSGGEAAKHAETFFETRQATKSDGNKELTARRPEWAVTVLSDKPGEAPRILVGRDGSQPLIVDPAAKSVAELSPRWPRNSSVIQHEGRFYIGSGSAGSSGQDSSLHVTDDPGKPPKLLVDFSKRPFDGSTWTSGAYYRSMAVFENHLHLLASQYDFKGRSPVWVAVDLTTGDAQYLAQRWPDDLAGDRHQDLRVSPRYGLLLISEGKAFRAELPPAETWPRMDATVVTKHLENKLIAD